MTKIFSKYKFWILVWIFFVLLRLPTLFEPYWYGDEGIYLTLGQGIRKGFLLYSQLHDNKPPTLYYLAAISQTVFGFRLLLSLVMIPTVYFFYQLSLNFLNQKLAKVSTFLFLVLTSIPFIEGNIANAEIFMLLPTILGFILFLKAKNNISYLFVGLLLGLAFTIKIPVFIEVFLLIIWLFVSNFSYTKKHFRSQFFKALCLGIGFIMPILIYLIYFTFLGAFLPFIKSALLQNFSYLSSWATGTQVAPATSGGLISRFLLLITTWIVILFLKAKKNIPQEISFLLFWLAAAIFGTLLSTRPYPHYLIQILPSICLLFPFIFSYKKHESLFSFLGLLITICIITKYKFYFYPVFKYYSNFYIPKSTTVYNQYFGSKVNDVYQLSSFLKQNSKSTDTIFVWGDEPYVYALSDRLPPGRYTVAYHIVDFNGYQETIESFKIKPPSFIIYYPMSNRQFTDLDNFIEKYYFLDHVFNSVLVYKKR